ncbi:hypothetical protein AOQ84DRAFT_435139 [Glonium stellatum]|uniref:BTB domain-containing protein n=1 Tax=Glonium stellatum TaxID=574774 RepID=A0A8E2FFX4_9PEZI|nr:hypothetical protein AOQ84DRAFT_435139 [Glonium stellatum]
MTLPANRRTKRAPYTNLQIANGIESLINSRTVKIYLGSSITFINVHEVKLSNASPFWRERLFGPIGKGEALKIDQDDTPAFKLLIAWLYDKHIIQAEDSDIMLANFHSNIFMYVRLWILAACLELSELQNITIVRVCHLLRHSSIRPELIIEIYERTQPGDKLRRLAAEDAAFRFVGDEHSLNFYRICEEASGDFRNDFVNCLTVYN